MATHVHHRRPAGSAAPRACPLVPFRWDVTRRERLGALADGPAAESYDGFVDHLRDCCARVTEAAAQLAGPAGEADAFFVGRSPESLFDYLRGICWGTPWFDRLRMLRLLAARHARAAGTPRIPGGAGGAARLPRRARTRPRVPPEPQPAGRLRGPRVRRGDVRQPRPPAAPVVLQRAGVCWYAARRNVRLVGITEREDKPPGGYRWHLHGPALDCLERGSATTCRCRRGCGTTWATNSRRWPSRTRRRRGGASGSPGRGAARPRAGLRLALGLFQAGAGRDERLHFVGALADAGGLRLAGLKALASRLRGG